MFITRRPIKAAEEVEVEVAPEATELLFEAEDVAELIAEVTEEVVEVAVDGDDVVFTVGEDEFVVTPDEGEEIELVETSRKLTKKPVESNQKAKARKAAVKSSRAVRKVRK